MKHILNIIIFLICSFCSAQEFTKADFKKTDWFADNQNGNFLKTDTIKLIKHSNKAPKWGYIKYREYEMKYLGHGDYVNLEFKSGNKMKFWLNVDNYMTVLDFKKYRWKFDKAESVISIYKENGLLIKLKPIESKEIEIESRLAQDKKLLKTTELTLIRVE